MRAAFVLAAALVVATSCSRATPRPARLEVAARALPPDAARRAAQEATDPIRAADLAWIEGNDRAFARAALDRAIVGAPNDPALLLRRALIAQQELDDAAARRDLLQILTGAPLSAEAEPAAALLLDLLEDDGLQRTELAQALDRSPLLQPVQKSAKSLPGPRVVALASLLRARLAGPREQGPWLARGGWITEVRSLGPLGARMQASLRSTTQHETEGLQPGARWRGLDVPIRSAPRRWLELLPVLGDLEGLYVLETHVRISGAKEQLLTVGLRAAGRVRVDGATVFERHIDQAGGSASTEVRLALEPGWHRIAVTLLASGSDGVRLSLLGTDGTPVIAEQRAEPPRKARFDAAPKTLPQEASLWQALIDGSIGRERELAARILGAWLAMTRFESDLERARALLRPVVPYAPESALVQALDARLMSAEGLPLSQVQAALRRALAKDPLLPKALVQLARTLESDSADQALVLADRALAAAPRSAEPELLRFRILKSRGWNAEAEAALRSALEKEPTKEVLQEAARFMRQQLRIAEAQTIEEKIIEHSASDALQRKAAARLMLGELDPALELLRTGAAASARPVESWTRIAELELARLKPDRAEDALAHARALDPFDPKLLRLSAIAARLEKDREKASAAVERLRTSGVADFELELFAAELEGRAPGEIPPQSWLGKELAIDPRALAKAPPDPRWAGDQRVRLLERIVDFVRPDGYALSMAHSVLRLQTKEATDEAGEFQLPGGALPLAMRTLKADGRVIDVDRHEGKADLSFSALAPGDAVEQKWLSFTAPVSAFGGYVRRFYFQTDAAAKRAELVVVVPKGLPVWWHAYHGAPEPEVHDEKDRRIYVFRADDVPGLAVEPSVAPFEEFLPFVAVAVGVDPALATEANAAPILGLARSAWDLRMVASVLVQGAASDQEKISRIYQWVIQNVRHGDFAEPHVVLATRRGDRTGLLVAMLRAVELDARIVLARPGGAAHVDPPYPDTDRFGALLAQVRLAGPGKQRTIWIRASGATPWIGLAPPEFRDGSYLALDDQGEPEVHDFAGAEIARWSIESQVELKIDASGEGRGTIMLTLPGQLGQGVRHGLKPLRPEDRSRAIQGWLSGVLPGAALESFEVHNLDDEVAPFSIRAALIVPGLFGVERGHLVANRFFNEPIGMRALGMPPLEAFIRISQRRMPLYVPEANERMQVVLHFPPGTAAPVETPQSFEKDASFAEIEQRFEWDAASSTARLDVVHNVPASRVAVKSFPDFREYVQEVALRTRNRLIVPLPVRASR